MKNVLLLLMFVPLMSFGQDNLTVVGVKSQTKISTNIENELVLSETSTNIKVPISVDLNNFTHILIIDYVYEHKWTNSYGPQRKFRSTSRYGNAKLEEALSYSSFTVLNPFEVKKSKAKKDPSYLKTLKDEKYLYLYVREGSGRGDDLNTTIIVRNSNNDKVYSATHINTGLNEVLAPLIDY
tara:strand:+ start:52 stop:597 length:546 start_codon:yes stop_codon:yes gene_type:complete